MRAQWETKNRRAHSATIDIDQLEDKTWQDVEQHSNFNTCCRPVSPHLLQCASPLEGIARSFLFPPTHPSDTVKCSVFFLQSHVHSSHRITHCQPVPCPTQTTQVGAVHRYHSYGNENSGPSHARQSRCRSCTWRSCAESLALHPLSALRAAESPARAAASNWAAASASGHFHCCAGTAARRPPFVRASCWAPTAPRHAAAAATNDLAY